MDVKLFIGVVRSSCSGKSRKSLGQRLPQIHSLNEKLDMELEKNKASGCVARDHCLFQFPTVNSSFFQ